MIHFNALLRASKLQLVGSSFRLFNKSLACHPILHFTRKITLNSAIHEGLRGEGRSRQRRSKDFSPEPHWKVAKSPRTVTREAFSPEDRRGRKPWSRPDGRKKPWSRPDGGKEPWSRPDEGKKPWSRPDEGKKPWSRPDEGKKPWSRPDEGKRPWSRPDGGKGRQSRQNRNRDFFDGSKDEFRTTRAVDRRIQSKPSSAPYRLRVTNASSEFIFGKNAVIAALTACRREFYTLYRITEGPQLRERKSTRHQPPTSEEDETAKLARKVGVAMIDVDKSWTSTFDRTAGERPHNGFILEASPIPLPMVKQLLVEQPSRNSTAQYDKEFTVLRDTSLNDAAIDRKRTVKFYSQSHRPIVVLLNNVVDPQNLGAILRSAHYFGIAGIALPSRQSAQPTSPTVLKASSGGAEAVNVFLTRDTDHFVAKSRLAGWMVLAATMPDDSLLSMRRKARFVIPTAKPLLDGLGSEMQPVLVILGGEKAGIDRALLRHADAYVSVRRGGPDTVHVDSLNVSVAAGLIFAEMTRKLTESALPAAEQLTKPQETGSWTGTNEEDHSDLLFEIPSEQRSD